MGRGAVIQTLRKGGAVSQKIFFWPFEPQFGLKIGGGAPGPIPWICHWTGIILVFCIGSSLREVVRYKSWLHMDV